MLISKPKEIVDLNKFTWLISQFINKPVFIDAFLQKIAESEKVDKWLNDYLFAAVNLIDNASSEYQLHIPEGLISKLQTQTLDNRGELSWKASALLKYIESSVVEEIFVKKLQERGDFFLTYVECIIGLLWYDKAKYIEFVKEISEDTTRDEKLREYAKETYKNYS